MRQPKRLSGAELAEYLREVPGELADLVLLLRDIVLEVAPEAAEAFRFHVPCYYKPDSPYGAIGGNICMIAAKDDHVTLGFIHGASLPDPAGLLEGNAKSARHVVIRSKKDAQRPEIRALIRASVRHTPAA